MGRLDGAAHRLGDDPIEWPQDGDHSAGAAVLAHILRDRQAAAVDRRLQGRLARCRNAVRADALPRRAHPDRRLQAVQRDCVARRARVRGRGGRRRRRRGRGQGRGALDGDHKARAAAAGG